MECREKGQLWNEAVYNEYICAIMLAFVVTGCSTESERWATDIEGIGQQAATLEEKFEAVTQYERAYVATIAELESYYQDIKEIFNNEAYLASLQEEALLVLLFKVTVVANQSSAVPQQFATIYVDNMRFVYLQVNESTSDQIIANEQRMTAILTNAL